eukprot:3152448-Alexandrium_andersonii.AAC.1
MGNEFEIFLHAHFTNLWQYTLRLEYGMVAGERAEIDLDLLVNEDILRNEKVAASVAQGLRSTIIHIARKMTEDRRQARVFQMNAVARAGHQFANLMGTGPRRPPDRSAGGDGALPPGPRGLGAGLGGSQVGPQPGWA